jgi:CHAT domain-containing protein
VITGTNATRLRLLGGAPVMHVAAPSYRNELYPSLSRLVLNDEPGRRYSGAVKSDEIARRPMTTTRLVVLDEIRARQSYRTAGSFDLATAFLAAGVPAVLGTLPGADESATRELMVGFHREVAGQASAAEALSRVQRNALKQNGGRLGAWTALVIYGSDR